MKKDCRQESSDQKRDGAPEDLKTLPAATRNYDSGFRSGRPVCSYMPMKGRNETPALGLRILQPYVPLRFIPNESVPAIGI